MKSGFTIPALMVGFALGASLNSSGAVQPDSPAVPASVKPAYLVAGWDVLNSGGLKPFSDAAVPLANKAGLQMLATSKAVLLEGQWPYSGIVIVQRYDSMQALHDFWYSREHIDAKKLREGLIDSHFVIAVEGR